MPVGHQKGTPDEAQDPLSRSYRCRRRQPWHSPAADRQVRATAAPVTDQTRADDVDPLGRQPGRARGLRARSSTTSTRRRTSTRSSRSPSRRAPTTTRSSRRRPPATCRASSTWTARSCPTGRGRSIIQPLELPDEITDSLLPTAVGDWQDEIYSVGYWDVALSIFARKSVLDENGIRIPTIDEPWTQRRVRRGPRHPARTRATRRHRHRRRGHRRMVVVRVLADAAELRRRPHRPRHDAHRRRRAQRPRGGRRSPSGSRTLFDERLRQQLRHHRQPGVHDGDVALSYTGVWNALDVASRRSVTTC